MKGEGQPGEVFKGRWDLDTDDPNYPDMYAAICVRAMQTGSDVVPLPYPRSTVEQVFVGTNHPIVIIDERSVTTDQSLR